MDFLEKDLEQIIWETDSETLEEKGLELNGRRFRQLRIGNYGIADLVTVEKRTTFSPYIDKDEEKFRVENSYLLITVYELKKDKIGIGAFLQAIGYVKGIQRYLEKRGYSENVLFKISLIGKEPDKSGNFIYLSDLIGFQMPDENPCYEWCKIVELSFYTYKISINGLNFNSEHGYKLNSEWF